MRKDESRRGQAAHTLPRRQFLLNIGLKNHSLRAVCTFHTRILSVNGHHLAGILGVKNVGTPFEACLFDGMDCPGELKHRWTVQPGSAYSFCV